MRKKRSIFIYIALILSMLFTPVFAANDHPGVDATISIIGDPGSVIEMNGTDVPMPQQSRITLDASGNGSFVVHLDDTGNYFYTVKQIPGTLSGIVYDPTVYNVAVYAVYENDEMIPIVVAQDAETKPDSIRFKNEMKKAKFKVTLQSLLTDLEIPGGILEIRSTDGRVIKRWVSTNEPIEVELEDGDYILVQIQAPEGYEITDPIPFTVKDGTVPGGIIIMKDPVPKKPDTPSKPDSPTPSSSTTDSTPTPNTNTSTTTTNNTVTNTEKYVYTPVEDQVVEQPQEEASFITWIREVGTGDSSTYILMISAAAICILTFVLYKNKKQETELEQD